MCHLSSFVVRDENAEISFSHRFGAPCDQWKSLLHKAKKLDLEVCGVHFHLGSGVTNFGQSDIFERALLDTQQLFHLARQIGFQYEHSWKKLHIRFVVQI